MNSREENHKRFEPVAGVVASFVRGCNAKVLHCENGPHKAGKPVELNVGENLLLIIARSKT